MPNEEKKLPSDELTENENNKELGDKQTCSKCGSENPRTNLFCNSCGQHFVDRVTCKKCGADVPIFNSFCGKCGTPTKRAANPAFAARRAVQTPAGNTQRPAQQQGIPGRQSQGMYPTTYRPLTPEERQLHYARLKKAEMDRSNFISMIFGVVLLIFGFIGFGFYILNILIISSEPFTNAVAEQLGIEGLDTLSIFYATMTAAILLPSVIFGISGSALIWYKPKNSARRGLYYSMRFIFIGLSVILFILVLIASTAWHFYNSNINASYALPIWLFTILRINVTTNPTIIYLVTFLAMLASIVSLVVPTFLALNKLSKEDKNTNTKDVSKTGSEKETSELIKETEKDQVDKELVSDDSTPILSLSSKNEVYLRKLYSMDKIDLMVEKEKGGINRFFYALKNSPLIKTIEYVGFSIIISYVVVLIAALFQTETGETPVDPTEDPYNLMISVAYAALTEEISFRLLLVGVPMIFVTLGRFYFKKYSIGSNLLSHEKPFVRVLAELVRGQNLGGDIGPLNIAFSWLGRNKKIGLIEWILIVFSSTMFGLAHWSGLGGGWDSWKIFQAGISGLFLGYVFIRFGLGASIFLHFVNNVIAGLTLASLEVGAPWIAGITGFVTFSLIMIGLMKGISLIINWVFRWNFFSKNIAKSALVPQKIE